MVIAWVGVKVVSAKNLSLPSGKISSSVSSMVIAWVGVKVVSATGGRVKGAAVKISVFCKKLVPPFRKDFFLCQLYGDCLGRCEGSFCHRGQSKGGCCENLSILPQNFRSLCWY